ncbi:hypothetical protein M427DRAFT_375551 [Gonapodya prolifera JEL478]|uniref:Uncharacterized protein n=1 Tax=Gonapodya prolifera (strain JEL478) TaxID=1344416 RepID=A0A139AVC4_GONPJ|nr:hypothetical protein M427DRAFT_375551 [Gonapodya prolifera JEL478]|eukprot:KXS20435.1 hypothetical protein M427DRAFT_375551 [Gonapodya prolifera JEL478]
MFSAFLTFLESQINVCGAPALAKYIRKTASSVFRQARDDSATSEEAYLTWSRLSGNPFDILEQGLVAFPGGRNLWFAKLEAQLNRFEEDTKSGRMNEEFSVLLGQAIAATKGIDVRIWLRYLRVLQQYSTSDSSKASDEGKAKMETAVVLEREYLRAIANVESFDVGEVEPLLEGYATWAWTQGAQKGRDVCDSLLRTKSRPVTFYMTCISLELKAAGLKSNILRHFSTSDLEANEESEHDAMAIDDEQEPGVLDHRNGSRTVNLHRVRRLFEEALARQQDSEREYEVLSSDLYYTT